jgi:DNA mismatch endonuclease (patch repair protein)
MGLRYRVDYQPLSHLRRRADIVFGPARVAVYIDGCFWHGCPEHGRRRSSPNSWYWPEKIAKNQARDADTDVHLHAAGWAVVRRWEHDDPQEVAEAIALLVRARRSVEGATGSPTTIGNCGEALEPAAVHEGS